DLGPADPTPFEATMGMARPRLLLGFKERSLPGDVHARLRRELATRVLLDRIFGPASEIRERLHREALVDDSLSYSYMSERTFGFSVVGCETERPEEVRAALREVLLEPVELDAEHIERVRNKLLGHWVRSFDSLQNLVFGHVEDAL